MSIHNLTVERLENAANDAFMGVHPLLNKLPDIPGNKEQADLIAAINTVLDQVQVIKNNLLSQTSGRRLFHKIEKRLTLDKERSTQYLKGFNCAAFNKAVDTIVQSKVRPTLDYKLGDFVDIDGAGHKCYLGNLEEEVFGLGQSHVSELQRFKSALYDRDVNENEISDLNRIKDELSEIKESRDVINAVCAIAGHSNDAAYQL